MDAMRKCIKNVRIKQICSIPCFLILAMLAGVFWLAPSNSGATVAEETYAITWDGGAGTYSWNDAGNWDLDRLPGPGDRVYIPDLPGDATIVFPGGVSEILSLNCEESLELRNGTLNITDITQDSAVNNLTLTGGTLGGSGNISVSGTFTWSGGTQTGAGTTTIGAGGLNITSNYAKYLRGGRIIVNNGSTVWTGGDIYSGEGAVFNNGGTFDVQCDRGFYSNLGGTATRFNNTGAFRKSAGSGTASMGIVFDNDGTVEANSGTLRFDGTGTADHSGSFSAGSMLEFSGGTHNLTGEVGGTGAVKISAGAVTFGAPYNVPSTGVTSGSATWNVAAATNEINVSSGTATFNNDINTGNINLSGGTLGGSGNVSVSGTFTWSGGTQTGAGTTTIGAGGLNITSNYAKYLRGGRIIVNNGSTVWTGGDIYSGEGAVFNNGGTFDVQCDRGFYYNLGGTATRFNNTGAFRKSAGSGTGSMGIVFDNDGTVEANSGTLRFDGTGTADHSGSFSAGSMLEFSGGTHNLTGEVSGTGAVKISAGAVTFGAPYNVPSTSVTYGSATWNVATTTNEINVSNGTAAFNNDINTGNINLSGGTLGGSGNVTVSGTFTWSGGTQTGAGTTTIGAGGLNITSNYAKYLRGGRIIVNNGSTVWTGGDIYSGEGAVFNNGGTFDVQCDRGFYYNLGGTATRFNNTGAFRKSAGGGTAVMGIVFDNDGTVEANSGTLRFDGTGTADHSGSFSAGSMLEFSGGTHNLTGEVSGTGAVKISGGAVTFGAPYNVLSTGVTSGNATWNVAAATNEINVSSGTATFNNDINTGNINLSGGTLGGSGNVSVSGTFTWSGGTQTGAGTTTIGAGGLNITSNYAKYLRGGRIIVNNGSTVWTGWDIYSGEGAVFNNGGTFDVQCDRGFYYNLGGTATRFNNTGAFRKSAGGGTAVMGIVFDNDGTVEAAFGKLNFGDLTNDLTISIRTAGVLGCQKFSQADTGRLQVEIGETSFGRLEVVSTASLAGSLDISLANGFTPSNGATFRIMTYYSKDGTFGTINNPPGGYLFTPTYNPKDLTLNVSIATAADAEISPNTASFDKKTENQADIIITVTPNGNTLNAIWNGGSVLNEGTDYTAAGNIYTIKKEYLASQPVGTTTLTFDFNQGVDPTLSVSVSDTSSPAALSFTNVELTGNPVAFKGATDSVVDSSGNLYVTDYYNNRVVKFDSTCSYVYSYGAQGSDIGQFYKLSGIAIDSADNLYVADTYNNRIVRFKDANNNGSIESDEWKAWGGAAGGGDWQFNKPMGVYVKGNKVYVADTYNHRIVTFNAADDPGTGSSWTTFGGKGAGDGQYNAPYDLVVDSQDNLWVSDTLNNRVQELDKDGNYLTQYASSLNYGIAIDSHDNVYAAERQTALIKCVNGGISYGGKTIFTSPVGVNVDGTGRLWIVDVTSGKVQCAQLNP